MDAEFAEIGRLLQEGAFQDAYDKAAKLAARHPDHPRTVFAAGAAAFEAGLYDEACGFFEKASLLSPNEPQIENNLGAVLMQLGRPADALPHFKKAVQFKSDFLNARLNLAMASRKTGALREAERELKRCRKQAGDDPAILREFVEVLFAMGRMRDAAEMCRLILKISPQDGPVTVKLTEILIGDGKFQEAQVAGLELVASAAIKAQIGDCFKAAGRSAEARRLYYAALSDDPALTKARLGLGELNRRDVARWHFSMLNDTHRNTAYEEAIKRAVRPDDVVLDIGTGSGLLSMMAARAGAKHVYTCEAVPVIADKAREIIALNGMADRITVFDGWSLGLRVGEHLPQKADVLVSEIVDNLLIGEGIMGTLDHALRHLVKPDARILPHSGRLFVTPVETEKLFLGDRAFTSSGFDVSPFNAFTEFGNFSSDQVTPSSYRPLGPDVEVFSFDFTMPGFQDELHETALQITEAGRMHGVLIWFDLAIDLKASINNHPERGREHWGCSFVFLDRSRDVTPGDVPRLVVAHDTTTVDFRFL
ncbi:MAG: tetratricopeptide repeat protein [Pseudomonadota bacterium]